jgi:hypothetical protein
VVDDPVEPVDELGAHVVEVGERAAVEERPLESQNARSARGLAFGSPRTARG